MVEVSSKDKQVKMTIKVPKGSDGAYIGGVSRYGEEAEILFDKNTFIETYSYRRRPLVTG